MQQRGRQKGSITRAYDYARNPPADSDVDNIETRIKRLDETWKEFQQTTNQLYEYGDVDGYVDPDEDFATYEEKYISTRGMLVAFKKTITPQISNVNREDPSDSFARLVEQQSSFLERISDTTGVGSNDAILRLVEQQSTFFWENGGVPFFK